MQAKPPRPTGVTIIGILGILAGLGLLAAAFAGGALIAALGAGDLAVVFSAVFIILGLVQLAVSFAVFSGKGWAWTLMLVLQVISLIFNIVSLPFSILGLIFNIIILYYLTRQHVKAFFGKVPWAPPTMGGGAMTAMTGVPQGGTTQASPTMVRCNSCGAMSPMGTTKCPSCGAAL